MPARLQNQLVPSRPLKIFWRDVYHLFSLTILSVFGKFVNSLEKLQLFWSLFSYFDSWGTDSSCARLLPNAFSFSCNEMASWSLHWSYLSSVKPVSASLLLSSCTLKQPCVLRRTLFLSIWLAFLAVGFKASCDWAWALTGSFVVAPEANSDILDIFSYGDMCKTWTHTGSLNPCFLGSKTRLWRYVIQE